MRVVLDTNVLVAALAGNADCLVTGDNDLLALTEINGRPIDSPRQFWERLKEHPPAGSGG